MSLDESSLIEDPSDPEIDERSGNSLRIWPPVVLMIGMLIFRSLPSMLEDPPAQIWMSSAFGPALCGILILLWWLFFSRATGRERLIGFFGTILLGALTLVLIDPTMRGPAVLVLTIPIATAAFGIGAIAGDQVLPERRTLITLLAAAAGFSVSTLLRSDGMWGDFSLGLHPRWAKTSEDELKNASSRPKANLAESALAESLSHPDWPGFRGPNRDGVQHGPMLSADWITTQPKLIWQIAVGPGWSSFAVAGQMLFTQEQRGTHETVVCYAADSGREIWTSEIESRFEDPLGGPGPRATPTLDEGALYVMGATGFLLKLDPATGEVIWKQDLREVAGRQPPMWGFSGSPLVSGSLVVVHAGGPGDKGVLAFEATDGTLKWSAPAGDHSYSSPQLGIVAGQQYVMMLTNKEFSLLEPTTGHVKLIYEWPFEGYRSCQPEVIEDDSILLPTGMGSETRCIRVFADGDHLRAKEVWASRHMKPEFNDWVTFEDNAYGFDSAIFSCISLETGLRVWKGGRYGKGQVLLQQESGLLIVMGEHGEVVLVKADPTSLIELGRFQGLSDKTWNHPVLIGDRLFIRNSQEAACYQLPLAEATDVQPKN